MPARISVEELQPLRSSLAPGAPQPARATRFPSLRAARARTRYQGAQVLSGRLQLSRRSAGGILDLASDALVERFSACLGVALLFWLPFGQITELIGPAEPGRGIGLSFLWQLVSVVPQALTTGVVTSVIGESLIESGRSGWAAALRGLRLAPGVLVIFVATRVVTLPLVVLCFLPYFLAQWLTWSAVAVYVFEGERLLSSAERARARRNPFAFLASFPRRVTRAIGRSLRLSSGWGPLGRFVVLGLVGLLLLAGLLDWTAALLIAPDAREFLRSHANLGGGPAEFVLGAVSASFLALASVFRAALATTYYLDLRVRKEGLDLELALQRLGQRPLQRPGARAA